MQKQQSLYFLGPRQVGVQSQNLQPPGRGQVTVRTRFSAISPGTEMLVYRDQVPKSLALDANIAALSGSSRHPFKYGYAAVGEIIAIGEEVSEDWLGARVFAFNPHEAYFNTTHTALIPLPEALTLEDAVFLPNMETALNLVMDGRPLIGERVAVLGQGIVGLLTTALLARFPLSDLVTFDHYANRRETSVNLGARAYHPDEIDSVIADWLPHSPTGADLIFELSGSPEALNTAIALSGYGSRIVIGSWYGQKQTPLDLGGTFHRNRVEMISSQVSTIAPALQGRWNKTRRFQAALQNLSQLTPARFITHRFPLEEAPQAYRLLDKNPGQAIQVIFEYP